MKQFCIVIPIYKEKPSKYELINLNSLINTIKGKKYDIYLICPESLNINNYLNIYSKFIRCEFNDIYFTNIYWYSQLCLQYNFYNKFSKYKYMYIMQTDVYIFKDEFKYWTKFNYDYIGAPIFSKSSTWDLVDENNQYDPKVGNGGFSLRKIETFKDITNPNGEFRTTYKLTDKILKSIYIEDKYFCNDIIKYYDLIVPSIEEALKFSWDQSIDFLLKYYKINYLPMAAHGTNKLLRFYAENYINEYKQLK